MPLFNSSKEKRYWLMVFMILIAIATTLVFGAPLGELIRDQEIQAIFFMTGLTGTAVTIILHGLIQKATHMEWIVWLGLATAYWMLFFRLGAPERSHLIEYGILAVFIHKAFMERWKLLDRRMKPGIAAFGLTLLIGVVDEGVQYFLPNRVFDINDLLFNALAAFMAIAGGLILTWLRNRMRPE